MFLFFALAIKTCALIDLVIITQIALNSFWPLLIFFLLLLKIDFRCLNCLNWKHQCVQDVNAWVKKFWNWVEFLWFNLMLVVHLSNIAKYCFNFVFIFYVLRFWTVYFFLKLCKLYIILNVCKLSNKWNVFLQLCGVTTYEKKKKTSL